MLVFTVTRKYWPLDWRPDELRPLLHPEKAKGTATRRPRNLAVMDIRPPIREAVRGAWRKSPRIIGARKSESNNHRGLSGGFLRGISGRRVLWSVSKRFHTDGGLA